MNIRRIIDVSALVIVTLVPASMPASADEWRGSERHDSERHSSEWLGSEWHGPRGPWHEDFRHFDRHDYELWRAGRWRQVQHRGLFGWWWVAGGEWFFYPRPVYPYPDPYAYVPTQTVVVQPSLPQTSAPPAPQFWYFCVAANGYYPYVPSCPGGWQAVPATPSAPPTATVSTTPPVMLPNAPPTTPPTTLPNPPSGYAPPAPPIK